MSRMLSFLGAGARSVPVSTSSPLLGTGFTSRSRRAALEAMDALLHREDVPAELAAPIHRQAANYYLEAEQYRSARQHLRALARLEPDCAQVHYDLGRAWELDPYGCDRRAALRYKKATQLNASEPKHRTALGRALVRINNVTSGVNVMTRAAEAAPADAEVLAIVVEGMREAGRPELAFDFLSKALFQAPQNRELKHLWERARYDMAHSRQKKTAPNAIRDQKPGNPKVLPFLRLAQEPGSNTRRDDASHAPAPHFIKMPMKKS